MLEEMNHSYYSYKSRFQTSEGIARCQMGVVLLVDASCQHNLYSFQVTLLMNALHVPACKCEICEPRYRSQVELFSKMKDASAVGTHAAQNVEHKPERKKTETAENGHAEQQVQLAFSSH